MRTTGTTSAAIPSYLRPLRADAEVKSSMSNVSHMRTNMRTSLKMAAFAAALASLLASTALANQLTITRIAGYYPTLGEASSGGEFNISGNDLTTYINGYPQSSPALVKLVNSGIGIETFCIEKSETINLGSQYSFSIDPYAVKGGGGAQNQQDPVSVGAAWLYRQFVEGTLSGYHYDPSSGRATSAGQLQTTIWWLENEGSDPTDSNPFRKLVNDYFTGLANPWVDYFFYHGQLIDALYFGVEAINLKDSLNNDRQSQLIYVGGGHTFVPDGGVSLMLLGLALGGLSLLRRKVA